MSVAESKLYTVKQFCEKHAWPSESAMRAIILDAPTNGFSRAFYRVGRRVLVNPQIFWEIIESKQEAANACA